MKTNKMYKLILFFILIFSYTTVIKAQDFFRFGGDESLNSGIVGWNVTSQINSIEPFKFGHTLPTLKDGGYCSAEYAYYYFASRDYSNIDTAKIKTLMSGYGTLVGFPKFSAVLKKYNKTISDIKISIGLLTLGNDKENVDWWLKGPIEKRIYHSNDYFYLLLDNDTLIRCQIPEVKQNINYNQAFDNVDLTKLYDDSISCITDFTIPENYSQNAKNSYSKEIALTLTDEIADFGIRFIIPKISYYSGGNYTINTAYNRAGSYFNIDGIIEKGFMPICVKSSINLLFDGTLTGNNLSINNSSIANNQNVLWLWTFGDGTQSNQKNILSHKFNVSAGNDYYNVCLTAYDTSIGCKTKYCKIFQTGVNKCNADFSLTVIDSSNSIIATNTSSTGVSWYWNFGDGLISTEENPNHSFANPGVYNVSLSTYRNIDGCTDQKTQSVQIGLNPVKADFDYYINLKKSFVLFNNKSTGSIDKVFWDFGNDHYSFAYNPFMIYPKSGIYNVCLTVKDAIGHTLDKFCDKLQIDSMPVCKARIAYYVDSLTNSVHFKNTSIGSINRMRWEFGDGSSSASANPTYTYKAAGFFKVKLTIFNDTTKCMDEQIENILVSNANRDCFADFEYVSNLKNNQVMFFNHSIGKNIDKYIWNFGDDTISYFDTNPFHTFMNPKNKSYPVCLNIIDTKNKCRNYICKNITIDSNSTIHCIARFDYMIDSIKKSVEFFDKSNGRLLSWNWDFDDGNTASTQNPSHIYSKNGFYKVHLQVTNASKTCINDAIRLINMNAGNKGLKNAFSYAIGTQFFNKGIFPVDFKGANYGDGSEAEWDFGDGSGTTNSENPIHNYDSAGAYIVCYKIINPITNDSSLTCDTVKVSATGIRQYNQYVNSFKYYPNPFQTDLNVEYTITKMTFFDVTLFDMNGKMIWNRLENNQMPGTYHFILQKNELNNGIYYLRLKTNEETLTGKLILIK